MNKREFLAAATCASAAFTLPSQAASTERGPALLTVTGTITRPNRGPLDPALDQLMKKQGARFDTAAAFDFAALAAMPQATVTPTLEYDSVRHTLRGPPLSEVLKAAGARESGATRLLLRAIDGYAPEIGLDDARRFGFIIATHLDGKPMPLGGLGPLWAVYEADRFAEMTAKPVSERFAACPWGLYHIEVR